MSYLQLIVREWRILLFTHLSSCYFMVTFALRLRDDYFRKGKRYGREPKAANDSDAV